MQEIYIIHFDCISEISALFSNTLLYQLSLVSQKINVVYFSQRTFVVEKNKLKNINKFSNVERLIFDVNCSKYKNLNNFHNLTFLEISNSGGQLKSKHFTKLLNLICKSNVTVDYNQLMNLTSLSCSIYDKQIPLALSSMTKLENLIIYSRYSDGALDFGNNERLTRLSVLCTNYQKSQHILNMNKLKYLRHLTLENMRNDIVLKINGEHLEYVNISRASIVFTSLSNVKYLRLTDLYSYKVLDGINSYKKLNILFARYISNDDFCKDLITLNLKNLEDLTINHTDYLFNSNNISDLLNLSSLSVFKNGLNQIGVFDISVLTNLKKLTMSNITILSFILPPNLKNIECTGLNCDFESFAHQIENIEHLENLNLNHFSDVNRNTNILRLNNDSIKNLKLLYIFDSKCVVILERMPNLEKLDIYRTIVDKFEYCNYNKLTSLNIINCSQCTIMNDITSLKSLRITRSYNKNIVFNKLMNLTELEIDNVKFNSIKHLTNLKVIHLGKIRRFMRLYSEEKIPSSIEIVYCEGRKKQYALFGNMKVYWN